MTGTRKRGRELFALLVVMLIFFVIWLAELDGKLAMNFKYRLPAMRIDIVSARQEDGKGYVIAQYSGKKFADMHVPGNVICQGETFEVQSYYVFGDAPDGEMFLTFSVVGNRISAIIHTRKEYRTAGGWLKKDLSESVFH